MSLFGLFKGKGPNGFGYNSTSDDVLDGLSLGGKTFLLTGCNSGLGFDTLRALTARGARVFALARSLEKARAACAEVSGGEPLGIACDLGEPESIRAAIGVIKSHGAPLDAIIANAGIMALSERELSHGYERQFFVNHVGHSMLILGLLGRLTKAGRVVMVSSDAHRRAYREGVRLDDLAAEKGYSPWGAYGQSKLANILFANQLATRLPHPKQTANSLHPGVIATNLGRHMGGFVQAVFKTLGPPLFLKSIPQGSATQCYVAAHHEVATSSGVFFRDCNPAQPNARGQDAALAVALWEETERIHAQLS